MYEEWTIFVVCSQSPDSRERTKSESASEPFNGLRRSVHSDEAGRLDPSESAGYSGREMNEIY